MVNIDEMVRAAVDAVTAGRAYGEAIAKDGVRSRSERGCQVVAALGIVATWAVGRRLADR